MADDSKEDKTEPASARKRADARAKGQVARSQEVNSALVLLASILALTWVGPHTGQEIASLARLYWGEGLHRAWTQTSVQGEMAFLLQHVAIALGPLLLLIGLAGVASNVLQVGFMLSAEPLKPNFSKLNPISGFKRLFSKNGMVELVKATIKIVVIGWVSWGTLRGEYGRLTPLMGAGLSQILPAVGTAVTHLALRLTLTLLLVALADYGWQKFEFEEGLRMTKEEVKDEAKQSEGDPRMKGRIRAMQRAMSRRRMMQDVPQADVVITNPTHYAIALRYESGKMDAPIVLAKGQNLIARRIKEIARDHNIPMVEDKPLAQALWKTAEIGSPIPMQFYEAIAEVLAFVYRLRARRREVL